MKIEAGMYVRTKQGCICKILKLNEPESDDGYLDFNDIGSQRIREKNIVKASYNIIDLIEVGDYVDGYLVIEKSYRYHGINFIPVDTTDSWGWGKGEMPFDGVKSIVTKEQLKSIEYVVDRGVS